MTPPDAAGFRKATVETGAPQRFMRLVVSE